MKDSSTWDIAHEGEAAAAQWYENNGFEVVYRNWRYHKVGEIDLIVKCTSSSLLVFCEVKTRREDSLNDTPASAVTKGKQIKLRKLTQCFLASEKGFEDFNIRFDVCEVIYSDTSADTAIVSVDIIQDAF